MKMSGYHFVSTQFGLQLEGFELFLCDSGYQIFVFGWIIKVDKTFIRLLIRVFAKGSASILLDKPID